jgi:hypothetical protein
MEADCLRYRVVAIPGGNRLDKVGPGQALVPQGIEAGALRRSQHFRQRPAGRHRNDHGQVRVPPHDHVGCIFPVPPVEAQRDHQLLAAGVGRQCARQACQDRRRQRDTKLPRAFAQLPGFRVTETEAYFVLDRLDTSRGLNARKAGRLCLGQRGGPVAPLSLTARARQPLVLGPDKFEIIRRRLERDILICAAQARVKQLHGPEIGNHLISPQYKRCPALADRPPDVGHGPISREEMPCLLRYELECLHAVSHVKVGGQL